ncbi:MAG: hypothetical protein ACTHZ5_06490 [Micrococcaceae bacterium]
MHDGLIFLLPADFFQSRTAFPEISQLSTTLWTSLRTPLRAHDAE